MNGTFGAEFLAKLETPVVGGLVDEAPQLGLSRSGRVYGDRFWNFVASIDETQYIYYPNA